MSTLLNLFKRSERGALAACLIVVLVLLALGAATNFGQIVPGTDTAQAEQPPNQEADPGANPAPPPEVAATADADQAPATVSGYQASVLSDKPVAYWRLEDSGGTQAADAAGGNPATLSSSGVALGSKGLLIQGPSAAATFDGRAGYLRAANPVPVGGDFTIEAWVKAATNPSSGTIVSLYAGGQSRTLYLNGRQFVGMADLSGAWPAYSVVGPEVDPSQWHHVVFVTQGGANLQLYIDGVRVGSSTIAVRQDFAANPVIGSSDADWMAHYSGVLDEVALYSTALPADRVLAHYVAAGPLCGGSLQTLINAAAPGAVVIVPACVYRETVTINKPLTLRGQPGAEIRGSDVWAGWSPAGGTWVSQQVLPKMPVFPNVDGRCAERTNRCLVNQQVFVDGKALSPVAAATKPGAGQFALDQGRHVVLGEDPAGHTVEVSTRESWVLTRSDDVRIEGVTMRHAANDALSGALSNDGYSRWTVASNVLSDAHGAVVSLKDGATLNLLANDISRGGNMGVHGTNFTGALVQGNHIHDNNTDSFSATWGAGGLKITGVRGVTIDQNEVDNNAGAGLWCDVACSDVSFSGNRVHNNTTQGIQFEISRTATISDNVVWQNGWGLDRLWGAGILISSSADVQVYDNAVAWNSVGISVIQQARQDGLNVRNVRVYDNAVLAVDGTVSLLWRADSAAGTAGLFDPASGNSGSRNKYWYPTAEGSQPRFEWNGPKNSLQDFLGSGGGTESSYLGASERDVVVAQNGLPPTPQGT